MSLQNVKVGDELVRVWTPAIKGAAERTRLVVVTIVSDKLFRVNNLPTRYRKDDGCEYPKSGRLSVRRGTPEEIAALKAEAEAESKAAVVRAAAAAAKDADPLWQMARTVYGKIEHGTKGGPCGDELLVKLGLERLRQIKAWLQECE